MQIALKQALSRWLLRRRGRESGTVVLVQRRVFILPTRYGYLFAVALLLMLTGSVNYNLSLGYVLTFLLGAMGINSILHTYRNLAGLRVSSGKARPVFAGGTAQLNVRLENPSSVARYAIGIKHAGSATHYRDVPAQASMMTHFDMAAVKRGVLRPGRITLLTRFPLGLFNAWSYVELDLFCLVYPRPERGPLPFPAAQSDAGEGSAFGQGAEDFFGLRPYHPGDSPRHIAWKADARGQGLLAKQFSGRSETRLWLDWDALAGEADVERKLAILTRWVLDAHEQGLAYGLRLPGQTLAPASGAAQRDACLQALALYGED
jgi:uncharacterized protein (DUF58 family)